MTDFSYDRNNIRTLSCSACLARLRDSYREQKGEPVSKEGRARRFKRAQRVVERALRARLQTERIRKTYREAKREWEEGAPDGRFIRGDLQRFLLKDEFWYGSLSDEDFEALREAWKGVPREEGPPGLEEIRTALYRKREYKGAMERHKNPYRQWEGYIDPREGSEAWEGPQDGWGGFPGESKAWESLREGWGKDTDRERGIRASIGVGESSTGPQESRESSIAPVNGLQDQFCSSCNQKKLLTNFGRFLTCSTCRERNKRANRARHVRQKALLNKTS